MERRYYSSRKHPKSLDIEGLYWKMQNLFMYFRDKDYFKGKTGITKFEIPDGIKYEVALAINFQPFPVTGWDHSSLEEDRIFDVLEFLYDRASKPGEMIDMISSTGYCYSDYNSYDDEMGKKEFRDQANAFLRDYGDGYELNKAGVILALGSNGLQHIIDAKIVPFDEVNVDSKVRNAVVKWRNRHHDLSERKQAIRDLADVFEWLKKTGDLSSVLNHKDESAIFEIANKFAIRHHDPKQKKDYDENIWYSWIFHFYLATYHAVIRLLKKGD